MKLTRVPVNERKENPMTTMTAVEIPASLIDQQSALNATIAQIIAEQSALTTRKSEAENSLARIDKVIRILRGEEILAPAGGVGTRKPMSQAGKDAIRAGLLRSAEAKKAAAVAASAVTAAPQTVPEPSAPTPAPVSPADTKGGKKATK